MLPLKLALLSLSATLHVHGARAQLRQVRELIDSIRTPPLTVFWQLGSSNLPQRGMLRCGRALSLSTSNPSATASTTYPLYMTLFPVGMQPSVQLVLDDPEVAFFEWEANLPVGTNFSLGMTDSSNPPNSGGVVDGFYIVDGFDNCTDAQPARRALTTVIDPPDRPCDEIAVRVSGGTPPFTASLISGTSGLYGNMTDIATSKFSLYNSIPSGQDFTLFITDSIGTSSNVSSVMTSGFGTSNCNRPGSTGDGGGTPLGAIIGGAVGGVIGAILLALLAWWLLRRRANKANQQYVASELATKGEFRMADGTVPLVQPFVVPQRSTDSEITPSPTSAHPSFSPHEFSYGSPYGAPPILPPTSTYSGSQASPASPASPSNYTPFGDEATYHSHPYDSTTGSSSGIALADPEEFSYREPGGTWSSNAPSLPRGAAPPSA